MKESKTLLVNKWQTPDGTILESKFVHDFVQYHDTVANDDYIVDGGAEYIRISENEVPMKDLCVYSTDNIEKIRENLKRGTLTENGMLYIPLKNMSNAHLENCITYNFEHGFKSNNAFTIQYMKELAYRFENNIYIEDCLYTKKDEE